MVREREYGTRVYREMFVLMGTDGQPLLEVRRNPASSGELGIHDPNETHIRLVNRTCYFEGAAQNLAEFLAQHDYSDLRISRVDICLDFEKFDSGDDPAKFVRRFFQGVYRKINQGNIRAHGKDGWEGQDWNSLSWGALSSDVGTKFYNKTMELRDAKSGSFKKPYILQAWRECGLIDDTFKCTRAGLEVQVWRLEFSIRSSVKRWCCLWLDGKKTRKQSIPNTLDVYSTRPRLIAVFASLQQHYFRFKYYEEGRRKDRCKDKELFRWHHQECTYKIDREDFVLEEPDTFDKNLNKLASLLKTWADTKLDPEIFRSVSVILKELQRDIADAYLSRPISREKRQYLQLLIGLTTRFKEHPVEFWMREVADILHLSKRVLPDNALVQDSAVGAKAVQ